jgi:hypothetical protein
MRYSRTFLSDQILVFHFGFPADKPEAFGVVLAHTTILFCFRELISNTIQELGWQAM